MMQWSCGILFKDIDFEEMSHPVFPPPSGRLLQD